MHPTPSKSGEAAQGSPNLSGTADGGIEMDGDELQGVDGARSGARGLPGGALIYSM